MESWTLKSDTECEECEKAMAAGTKTYADDRDLCKPCAEEAAHWDSVFAAEDHYTRRAESGWSDQ